MARSTSSLAISKLDAFDGTSFNSWYRKVEFGMLRDEVEYVVSVNKEDAIGTGEGQVTEYKWGIDNRYCKAYIINNLSDRLAEIYSKFNTAAEVWKALKDQFEKEEETSKTHITDKLFTYSFDNDKPLYPQVTEYVNIIDKIKNENIPVHDSIVTSGIIVKLPTSWDEFKIEMYRKSKQVTLEQLKRWILIQDETRARIKQETVDKQSSAANYVNKSHKNSTSNKSKGKSANVPPKATSFKKVKRKVKCFNCDKWGHYATECNAPKKPKTMAILEKKKKEAESTNLVAMLGKSSISRPSEWYMDSGATVHVTNSLAGLTGTSKIEEHVSVANGNLVQVDMEGTATLPLSSGNNLILHHVKFIPSCPKNLISISLLVVAGINLEFKGSKVVIKNNTTYFGCSYLVNGMFRISLAKDYFKQVNQVSQCPKDITYWHKRLGHINFRRLLAVAKSNNIPLDRNAKNHKCEVCAQTKTVRKSHHKVNRSTSLLELIHSDICDFKSFTTRGGKKYMITFIDDHSRFCHIYLLRTKDEALSKFVEFKNRVENQLSIKIKRFRSDRGGEYTSKEFKEFSSSQGIILETTSPYSPQSNGVAERKNRTLTEMLNSMLLTAGLPSSFWGEAVLYANKILNRVPHAKLESTPYELWFNRKPTFDRIKTWGCIAYVRLPDLKVSKVGPRTHTCIFLGSAIDSAADRFLDLSTNVVIESQDAEFFEHLFLKDKGITLPGQPVTESNSQEELEQENAATEQEMISQPEIRVSSRGRIPKEKDKDFIYQVESDPTSYGEAMNSRDCLMWKEAIEDEMNSLLENQTWTLVDLPKGAKIIGSKWVFKKKLNNDRTVAKYKARLVAKGFTQVKGIDYNDTYSPVCHQATIRILLALASIEKWVVHQMDVKTAFLNGDLTEELYLSQPEGFVVAGLENKVCKLNKSLYGLKQAPKLWHEKFDSVIKSHGFIDSKSDKCLYIKSISNKVALVCLYVDDMLIIGSDLEIVNDTKKLLTNEFSMKDMGVIDTILGMKVDFTEQGITLSQSHYITNLLKDWGYDKVCDKKCETPYDAYRKLTPNEGQPVKQLEYAQLVGSLMYAMCCTRPDIAHAVGMLSRFTSNPSAVHWQAIDRLMRYLNNTKEYALCYKGYPPVAEGFSDATWNSEKDDHRSISGLVFLLGGASIIWKSKRQSILALSSMESEIHALSSAGEQAEWMKDLLQDIPLKVMKVTNITIHCDNMAAKNIANNSLFNGKRRNIRLKQAYLNYLIDHGYITVTYVGTMDNLADFLTKGQTKGRILKASTQMGLQPCRHKST